MNEVSYTKCWLSVGYHAIFKCSTRYGMIQFLTWCYFCSLIYDHYLFAFHVSVNGRFTLAEKQSIPLSSGVIKQKNCLRFLEEKQICWRKFRFPSNIQFRIFPCIKFQRKSSLLKSHYIWFFYKFMYLWSH